jgi:hypothetical protein
MDTCGRVNNNPDVIMKINSLKNYWDKNGFITENQYNMFLNFEEKFSPRRLQEEKDWLANYDYEKRNTFKLALEYYRRTTYFQDIVRKAITTKDFIPDSREYAKFCENPYVKRAFEAYNSSPVYSHGDIVTIRKSYSPWGEQQIGMVQSISDTQTFCKGLRRYTIMWFTSNKISETEERALKLYREPKAAKKVK